MQVNLGIVNLLETNGLLWSGEFSSPVISISQSREPVLSKIFMIKNKFGLHARPSASFVQTASRFHSDIKVEKDGQVADGKSILDLMMLAAAQGARITIKAQGEDAQEALQALEELIEKRFGED